MLTFGLLSGCSSNGVNPQPTQETPASHACWTVAPFLKTTDVQSINCLLVCVYPNADSATKVSALVTRPDGTRDPLALTQQSDTFTTTYQVSGPGTYNVEIKIIIGDKTFPETLTFDVKES